MLPGGVPFLRGVGVRVVNSVMLVEVVIGGIGRGGRGMRLQTNVHFLLHFCHFQSIIPTPMSLKILTQQ